jgi:hypothetical protein
MIKLKSLLKEAEDAKKDKKGIEDQTSVSDAVIKYFESNKKAFEKLADADEWDDFYDKAFDKFPEADQDDVAQALNKAAMLAGIFDDSEGVEMPTEKELEKLAFGEKSLQKGVKMGDYDKKNKSPKASPTELYIESKKKDSLDEVIEEAEYHGRKVSLGKPFYTPGGPRKRAVYVKNDKGNVVKVGFGDPNMKIKKSNPARRRSFRARHKCDTAKDRTTARYWSCKFW